MKNGTILFVMIIYDITIEKLVRSLLYLRYFDAQTFQHDKCHPRLEGVICKHICMHSNSMIIPCKAGIKSMLEHLYS